MGGEDNIRLAPGGVKIGGGNRDVAEAPGALELLGFVRRWRAPGPLDLDPLLQLAETGVVAMARQGHLENRLGQRGLLGLHTLGDFIGQVVRIGCQGVGHLVGIGRLEAVCHGHRSAGGLGLGGEPRQLRSGGLGGEARDVHEQGLGDVGEVGISGAERLF